jgi:hypothetical protein
MNSFTKCFHYTETKRAIERNDIASLERMRATLNNYGLSFKSFSNLESKNDYTLGSLYIPPLEVAMKNRSFSAFRYILEETLDWHSNSIRTKTKQSALFNQKLLDHSLGRLREIAENEKIFEIIDILNNYEEDVEILMAMKEDAFSNFKPNLMNIIDENGFIDKDQIINNIKHNNTIDTGAKVAPINNKNRQQQPKQLQRRSSFSQKSKRQTNNNSKTKVRNSYDVNSSGDHFDEATNEANQKNQSKYCSIQ